MNKRTPLTTYIQNALQPVGDLYPFWALVSGGLISGKIATAEAFIAVTKTMSKFTIPKTAQAYIDKFTAPKETQKEDSEKEPDIVLDDTFVLVDVQLLVGNTVMPLPFAFVQFSQIGAWGEYEIRLQSDVDAYHNG